MEVIREVTDSDIEDAEDLPEADARALAHFLEDSPPKRMVRRVLLAWGTEGDEPDHNPNPGE